MTDIFFCASHNRQMISLLYPYSVSCKSFPLQNSDHSYSQGTCISTDFLSSSNLKSAIIVLDDSYPKEPFPIEKYTSVVVLVNSAHSVCADYASQNNFPTISCGFYMGDTLTLCSYQEDSAVISLQRSIYSLVGTKIDPVDIPVFTGYPMEPFILLALTTICLLCDRTDLLSNIFSSHLNPLTSSNSLYKNLL